MSIRKYISRQLRRQLREYPLGKAGIGIVARAKNGTLVVEAGDFGVGKILLETGEYDWEKIQWLTSLLNRETSNVVVVGAHIGSVLIPISKSCKQIVAFEADAKNFSLLECNLRLNDCTNVYARNNAVGDRNEMVSVVRNTINSGNNSISKSDQDDVNAQMIKLDSEVNFEEIDLIVMDIEGYEPFALCGATEVLNRAKMIYIEYAPREIEKYNNDSVEMADGLFEQFKYMYVMHGGDMGSYTRDDGMKWIESLNAEMGDKKFLRDLLFTKNPISS